MADAANQNDKPQSKIDAAAEKAYAEAAANKGIAAKVEKAVEADGPKPEPKIAEIKKAVEAPAAKPAASKAPAKKAPAKKAVAKKSKPAAKKAPAKKVAAKKAPAKAAAKKPASTQTTKINTLKETIMATAKTAKTTDYTASAKEMAAKAQERMKSAYSTAGEFAGEFGEFNKKNVEAMVESGKIFFAGAQDMTRENVEAGKTVVSTFTEDAKKMVAVKSPTELFQLQGELARRNFDAVVGFGSKRTEEIVKLYTDAFAPISNRVSVAAEKISKAA